MIPLILASGSITRARMLEAAGVPFEIMPAAVDEEMAKASLAAEGLKAGGIADGLAELKAIRRSISRPGVLVLGADQVLEFEGACISKSTNLAEAEAVLCRLRGKRHRLISAAVLARDGQALWRSAQTATLQMRNFSDAFLAAYLQKESTAVLASVGCYRLEGSGAQLFSSIEGDYFAILGLPLMPILDALRQHGVLQT